MTAIIVLFILAIMISPSTIINVHTEWFDYEYSAKRMYDFKKRLFNKIIGR